MLDDIGTLEAGKFCDLAIWDIERPAELVYRIGANPLHNASGEANELYRNRGRRLAGRLARIYRGETPLLDPACHAGIAQAQPRSRAFWREGRAGLRHQHRLRQTGQRPHQRCRSG
jgi:hypothetical protein